MSDEIEERKPAPIELMAKDLGLDPASVADLNLKDVIKQGPESALFFARVSQVYLQSSNNAEEVKELKAKLAATETAREEARARAEASERRS